MRADAVGQYLAWKRWPNWLLLRGESAADQEMAADIRRFAERFGAHIVEERTYGYNPGATSDQSASIDRMKLLAKTKS